MINHLIIDGAHLQSGIVPLDIIHFLHSKFVERLVHRRILHNRVNSIRHRVNIPVIGLNSMLQNLCAAGLMRNDTRTTDLHRL